jgi:hypothetical protein
MAENNSPKFTVKHVDGVMHLTLQTETKATTPTGNIGPLPAKVESAK